MTLCRLFSVEEDHDDAADGWHGDDADFQEGQWCEMRSLCTEPGAEHETEQGLNKNRKVQTPIEQIAESPGR